MKSVLPAARTVIGLAADGTPITALVGDDATGYATHRLRVLLIGTSEQHLARIFDWFHSAASGLARFTLTVVRDPVPAASYPPQGEAYAAAPEAHCLWRWTGIHAPDVVLIEGTATRPDDLGSQLGRVAAAGVGIIPVIRLARLSEATLAAALNGWQGGPSPARLEMWRRLARTPGEIAGQLSARYANRLDEAVYIPAMALVGRLRLGETAAVEAIVAPYLDGRKQALAGLTSSHFGGHLLFAELAAITGKTAYLDLARAAADLAFDEHGRAREAMPLHDEMSDSLFLVCPLLAQVGALTGNGDYVAMCGRHMRFIRQRTWRDDGLYRHSPLNDAAWGRGNGFAALGLAWSLDHLPAGDQVRTEALDAFRAHMKALLAHQDTAGMWHQVIDVPGSYRELSATCMIAAALARGLRNGWLPAAPYGAALARAWYAIRSRISGAGELVDVCAGTGKQDSLRAYLARPALLGMDPRGGAMALLIATELMADGRHCRTGQPPVVRGSA
ncbi:Rhamnogalacturonyl hydrolase YesR [Massilia sp. PDC64]|nr:glycoside hydrolase family 88 protein [Massilia sp. PDC64]SDE78965.1 Rhamnogalacturonyl hydrolase YesR [Massilia sp. PDC64]